MNNDMYIRFDDTGITVSSSRVEFAKKPVNLVEIDDPVRIGSRITISNFYNMKLMAVVLVLSCFPLIFGLNEAFPTNQDEIKAARTEKVMREVRARCAKGNVDRVTITSITSTKIIKCGELS